MIPRDTTTQRRKQTIKAGKKLAFAKEIDEKQIKQRSLIALKRKSEIVSIQLKNAANQFANTNRPASWTKAP